MAKLIIDGITAEQAKTLAEWYEGQGEQDASTWFECQDEEIEAPMSDVRREGGCMAHIGEDTILYCK